MGCANWPIFPSIPPNPPKGGGIDERAILFILNMPLIGMSLLLVLIFVPEDEWKNHEKLYSHQRVLVVDNYNPGTYPSVTLKDPNTLEVFPERRYHAKYWSGGKSVYVGKTVKITCEYQRNKKGEVRVAFPKLWSEL